MSPFLVIYSLPLVQGESLGIIIGLPAIFVAGPIFKNQEIGNLCGRSRQHDLAVICEVVWLFVTADVSDQEYLLNFFSSNFGISLFSSKV